MHALISSYHRSVATVDYLNEYDVKELEVALECFQELRMNTVDTDPSLA